MKRRRVFLRLLLIMSSPCGGNETVVVVDPVDDSRALVRYANCSTEVVKTRLTRDRLRVLDLKRRGICRVESVPVATQLLDVSWNPGVSADMSTFASVTVVYLRGCGLRSVGSFAWPPRLVELNLRANELSSFDASLVSSGIRKLKLSQNRLESLDGLAQLPNLEILLASENRVRSIVTLPEKLKELDVSENSIFELKDLSLPQSLVKLNISFNAIVNISNVSFPASLRLVDMKGNSFQSFAMYESDAEHFRDGVTVLSRITDWSFNANTCQAPSSLRWVGLVPVCVMADRVASDGSSDVPSPTSSPAPGTDKPSPLGGMKEHRETEDQNAGLLVAGGTAAMLLVVLVLFGITLVTGHRQNQRRHTLESSAASHTTSKSDASQTTDSSLNSHEPSISDHSITSSPNLVDGTIPMPARVRRTTLTTRSCGEIDVACVGRNKHDTMVVKIVNDRSECARRLLEVEIQQCEPLQHPNLVRFLGSVTEECHIVGYACEYHANHCDLGTALARTKLGGVNKFQWLTVPGSSGPTKLNVALQILEGLLFVQQSRVAAAHQSLNSKSVLVTADWRSVRLSLFSFFRNRSHNGTMTGTDIPWVAPEVLKGGACDLRANVYSLGIILTLLDNCEYPYHDGVESFLPRHPSGTRVAIIVGSGSVQPALGSGCPHQIRNLITICLSFDPVERPALNEARESLHELQNL